MSFEAPDLPVKFEAFREALAWATGAVVFWENQALEGRHREANRVWGELQIFRIKRLGIDDIRYEGTGDDDWPTRGYQSGNRILTFQLKMKSRSQEHITSAWYAAAKAQTRINSPFCRDHFLRPNDLALATVGDILDALRGVVGDDRAEDVAIIEFFMNTTLSDKEVANVTSWIESCEASTGLEYLDGNDLPAGLQWSDEAIP